MGRVLLIAFCIVLITLVGCKPKRDARCPPIEEQIGVSVQIALVDDGRTEAYVKDLDVDDLMASGNGFFKETVSTGMQGKLVSYYFARSDDTSGDGRTGREILHSQLDESKVPASRTLGYSRKANPEGPGYIWRTYLLVDPPSIVDDTVKSAVIEEDEQTGKTILRLTLDSKGKQAFAQLTADNLDRRIAIIINDEVLQTLQIWEKNEAGELLIPIDRLGVDEPTQWQHACGLLR